MFISSSTMMTQPLGTKRKHQQQNKLKRNPLGVVEFTSALNGDDPYEILKKLHRFVRVVSYERFLALSPRDNDVKNADVKNDNCSVDDEVKEDEAGIDNTDEDVMSILSFDEDHDSKLLNPKTKRQKPDWQTDKNNYLVPFVGTSVTKGQTGSVVPHSQIWPSGFLEVYLKHSPMGVELLENDFVGALPPSGVHKILLGNEENNFESSDQRKRKKNDVFGGDCAQSRGQIVSIALQTNYWMALAEWISGFVSKEKLQREIFWDWAVFGRGYFRSRSTGDSARNNKCAISPNIMSILMKIRLPEWLDVIQKYEKMQNDIILRQQRERRQQKQKQQKLQKKHNVKEGHHQKPVEQQMPEEDTQKQLRNEILNRKWQIRRDRLLASALKNLTYLCLLSNGTAREVVRKLSARSDTGSCEVDSREKIIHHKGGTNTTDGISWMVQILEHQFSNEKLEQKFNAMLPIKNHNLQTECLRLVCTLLETRDTTILSRIAEVPTRFVKRGGAGKDSKGFRPNVGSSFGGGAVGVIYIVLRFGTQRLINIYEASVQSKIGAKVGRNSHEDEETSAMYARYMVRFLSGIRDILLPSSVCSDHDSERNSRVKNTIHIGDHDFPIAPSLMVNLLTGEILNNLAKLSRLAPTIDTNTDPVKDLIEGKSIFEGLVDPMESACTEARRLLFILLADAKSSPFLHHLQHLKNIDANKFIEQAGLFLPQLGMTLHSMMIGQGYNLPMRIFLNRCLNTTPELVPHFFKTLQLNEPKPNYRTISSLSFIEGILRAAPALNHWTYLGKTFSAGEARGTISTRWALSSIIPPCVTKLILAKVVQSPSALLVSSGLKLLATILRRTRECTLSWAITSVPGNNGACNELFQEVLHHLPDVSLLLSIPSRFDPYKSTQCDASSNANSIVMIHLCETIQCIVKLDPVSVMNIKFDWVKFLPNESTHSSAIDGTTMLGFHNVEPLLQHRILQTLLVVSKLCNISFSNKMLLSVLTLLVSTDIPDVYSIARDLAISLMEKELFRDTFFRSIDMSIDERSCHAYESSLWVDGISSLSIEYLVAWLAGCRQLKVQQKIMISQAWSKATLSDKVPPMSVSALLLSTVCHIVRGQASKSNLSDHFSMLVIDIAVEMLLYQTDPRPFAAVIVFNSHNMIPIDEHTARLIKLAKVVLSHNDPGSNGDSSLLSSGIFEKHFNRLQRLSRLENCTSIVHLRQCLSLLKVSGDQYDALSEILIKSINQLLMAENDVPDVIARLGVAVRGQDIVPSDRECVIALLLTFIGSTQFCVNHHRMTQTSILGTEQNEGILSTLGTSIIYALMQSAFVPCELSDGALSDLWKHCILFMKSENTHAPHLETFLLRVILKTTPDISTRTKRFALVEVFELWAILSEDLSNQLVSELTFCLEEILSASFAKNDDGWGTWNVYKRICDLSAQKFSKLCWNSLKKNYLLCNGSRPTFVNGKDFLSEVINYDSSKFDFLPDMLINAESNREMKPILDCGYLDPIAATYVLKAFSQKNAESIKATSGFANAAKHIGKSLLSRLLAHIERDNAFVIDLVLEAIQTLCLNKLMLLETSNKLAELMDHLENSRKNISIDREIKVFDLTSCVISPLLTSELLDASTLLTKTFLRICAVFTKCLKRMKRSRHDTLEYSTTQLMYCFSSFLQRSDYFDKSMINELSTSVDNIIVLCLKYGMMEPDNVTSSSILGGCLKMVRLMLSQSSPRNSSEHQIRLGNMSPAHVHALIVSHSSFRSALVGRCTVTKKEVDGLAGSKFCEGLAQRFELLSLMICCASLDVETTTISKKAWDALLSVYNASTSPFDTLIRRLLFLYEKRTSFPVQMNELRWGQPHVKYSSDNVSSSGTSHDWDWFVDSIDLGRVRSTLSQFPVSDTLKPSSLISNDSCGKIPVHSFHVSLDNEVDYGSDNESGDDDQTTRSNELQRVNEWPTENYAVEEWRGPGEDPRYSPGFILPLILATMETSLPMAVASKYEREKHENELSASDESYNAKNETDNIQCREFCQICRRLYNNGAISLAVASLSSQCPSLRKVALSICGLFLESLQIQKSSLLKDWRERPQLEMLMSSIQRGLSVRRSIRIKKIQGSSGGAALRDDGEATSKLNVTMLPAFSAVFLAKALLILSRPADDMYGQMNRYFLRLTQFHGAFQDFFGLPGFLSLYCSSSDDLLRCKSERNWALQLLIDGAVDEFSFRIIARHHVPELIMSSVGSQIDCPGKKSEILIAIDALRTLIECGGPSAISHIVMRQGLLSWLHGIVNWRKVSALFPFDDMKCKFLRLIVAAVKCHRSHTSTPGDGHEYCSISAFHEGVPLADVVIRIFLDSKINTDTDVNVSINGNQTELYELTCDALWEVYLTTPQKIMGKRCSECHGMTMLDDMTSVLEKFATHKQMCARVLAALCALPLASSSARDDVSAKTFCDIALGFILSKLPTPSSDLVAICLRRILELIQCYGVLASDPSFSSRFMKARTLAVKLEDGVTVWNEILKVLNK